ncbi:low-affinity inorganic phosphate transporter [Streptomyces sp. NBRC 110611]|nr:low-affinity inorganic phosphate transporter [Streptomyces sp. NBRC 110611]
MGVITLALITGGVVAPHADPPLWVIASAGLAIALGTYLGGWRIIRTMGKGITDIQPPQGFAAQTGAAATILASSHLGFALSTTQVCSGAVTGSGLGRKGGVVRWSTAGRMVAAWALTLPAAGAVAAGAALLAKQGTWGVTATAVLALGVSGAIWAASRRNTIDHTNVNEVPAAEPAGVVTTAIRAVSPPPAGQPAASADASHATDASHTADEPDAAHHDSPSAPRAQAATVAP